MFDNIIQFLKGIITISSYKNNLIDSYVQLCEMEKIIKEKKAEIKENLQAGNYENGKCFKNASVTYVSNHELNINKCFSFLLRKGKMKAFLRSCTVYKNALRENGIDEKTINSFQEHKGSYKKIVAR